MKEHLIEGIHVLVPTTAQELEEAVESGRPFLAPDRLAREFGLPEDEEDVGVLDDIIGPGPYAP